jgi:hypothetical protein
MKTEFDNTENEALNKTDVSGSLPSFADWLSENYYETQNGRFAKKGDHPNDEFISLEIADVYKVYKSR